MSKAKKLSQSAADQQSKSPLANHGVVDPALVSLFASSSGPVKVPARSATSTIPLSKGTTEKSTAKQITKQVPDEDLSSAPEASTDSDYETKEEAHPRKRRKVDQSDDLETTYLNKLVQEEEKELKQRRIEKAQESHGTHSKDIIVSEQEDEASTDSEADSESETGETFGADGDVLPVHESLQKPVLEDDKSKRTVFMSNVSTKAITSKSARKTLLTHLKSAINTSLSEKVESIRFRSTAFVSGVGPKRAAYAKKELMEETARNTNAYVVFSSEAAARKVALKLNGTLVLDRHVHVDSLANPTKTDHKRCVFVGNLPFVDEETNEQEDPRTGEKRQRPRAKEPADAEEGLWRVFGKCGTIESVRVVRDKATRVGKGFAYVQFTDQNGVERALEFEGKRFPPLLPRTLRVMRAKKIQKKELRAKERVGGGRGAAGRPGGKNLRKGKLDGVVFEGYRASSGANSIKLKGKSRGKDGKKPKGRSSRRGAAFKAGGGKKRRDA